MLIYPAIDLIEGRCVRLLHGDFDQVTQYGDPLDQIKAFADAGAAWVHIVDLDGARAGAPKQTALLSRLARERLQLQTGGGVRQRRDIEALLDAGAARVVVGSSAVRDPAQTTDWLRTFGADRVCCAFDVRAKGAAFEVAVSGWRESSAVKLDAAIEAVPANALRHVLITDISRDGALSGPNIALVRQVAEAFPHLHVQASGGVSSLSDITALRQAHATGVIIGRALYERRFTLEEALAC